VASMAMSRKAAPLGRVRMGGQSTPIVIVKR
jgi:hypothetical protein